MRLTCRSGDFLADRFLPFLSIDKHSAVVQFIHCFFNFILLHFFQAKRIPLLLSFLARGRRVMYSTSPFRLRDYFGHCFLVSYLASCSEAALWLAGLFSLAVAHTHPSHQRYSMHYLSLFSSLLLPIAKRCDASTVDFEAANP